MNVSKFVQDFKYPTALFMKALWLCLRRYLPQTDNRSSAASDTKLTHGTRHDLSTLNHCLTPSSSAAASPPASPLAYVHILMVPSSPPEA